MTEKKPLVMITGASAGIGQETARVFSAAGYPLLLIARRPDLIEARGGITANEQRLLEEFPPVPYP